MCKKSKHHTFYNGCLYFKNQNMSQFTIDKVLTMHVSYRLKIKHEISITCILHKVK